jgi:hypothetical protein
MNARALSAARSPPGPVLVLCAWAGPFDVVAAHLGCASDLACPPETSLPALLEKLAVVWSLVEGAPLSPSRDDAHPAVPDSAVASVRRTVDIILPHYALARTYCGSSHTCGSNGSGEVKDTHTSPR